MVHYWVGVGWGVGKRHDMCIRACKIEAASIIDNGDLSWDDEPSERTAAATSSRKRATALALSESDGTGTRKLIVDTNAGLKEACEPPSKSIVFAWYKNISYRSLGGPYRFPVFCSNQHEILQQCKGISFTDSDLNCRGWIKGLSLSLRLQPCWGAI